MGELSIWRRLIQDARISHGAFRLWHYLNDRKNAESVCWPQQRTIAGELHCKIHSLSGWTSELVQCGYLSVEQRGANHHNVYRILDGTVLPKPASPRDAQTGNTNDVALPKPATPVLPISAVRDAQTGNARVAQTGNGSNNQEVIPRSKGGPTPPRSASQPDIRTDWQLSKDRERLLRDIRTERDMASPDALVIEGWKKQLKATITEMRRRATNN